MKGFKKKPAVLPAAEPSAAKFGEDEAAPETRFEGGARGSGETGIAGHKKKRAGNGLPPWLRIKPQDHWPLVRVVLVVVLCVSAGWYFVDFYGGKDAQAGQALPGGGAVPAQVRAVQGRREARFQRRRHQRRRLLPQLNGRPQPRKPRSALRL